MPIAFALALAASLGIHVAALFGTDVELFGGGSEESLVLQAELQAPPPPPPPVAVSRPEPKAAVKKPARPKPVAKARPPAGPETASPAPLASTPAVPMAPAVPVAPAASPADSDIGGNLPSTAGPAADSTTAGVAEVPPAQALLPASGSIRYAISYGEQGFVIGRAEHHWEFTADGRYRLRGMTETSGLVALFKSVRFENESSGRLVAGGLQPEHYVTRKNGKDANENAEFDWVNGQVRLSRDGKTQPIARGSQDILSLNYHLAYLPRPESGSRVGVVTGKKYERYALDSLGEEILDLPAGRFRTLHLRAMTDSVTEIWLALDHHRLPVKIRFTDRKGDVYQQVATEIPMISSANPIRSQPSEGAPALPEAARQESAK